MSGNSSQPNMNPYGEHGQQFGQPHMQQQMMNPYAEHYGQQFGMHQGLAGMMTPPPSPHIGTFPGAIQGQVMMPPQGMGEPPPGFMAGMPKGQGVPLGPMDGIPQPQRYAAGGPPTRGPMGPMGPLGPFNRTTQPPPRYDPRFAIM